jgi:hypothetical protein
MQKFKVWTTFVEIKPVDVISESEHYVFLPHGREAKLTSTSAYLDTFEEARSWLLSKKQEELQKVFDEACRIAQEVEDIKNLETTSGE